MAQTTSLGVGRLFTPKKGLAYDQLKWAKQDSVIKNPNTEEVVFEQKNVEFPEDWSLNAVNIVSQQYFSGTPGTSERESSLRQLVDRVADTITRQGIQEGYFDSESTAEDFREELKYILITQRAAFNSPVWFNIGVKNRRQQASACFILSIEDNMPSILNWYLEEAVIFNGGSGPGVNISPVRSSMESFGKSSGTASGPLSFMRGADASAAAIKSGGKTRSAAKMVILNADHPDVDEFIWSKAVEQRKAHDLAAAGWDTDPHGKDSFSVQYQKTNTSVRLTDEFMKAVEEDADWELKTVTTGRSIKKVKATDVFRQIAEAAWECADPGIQFDTTINRWNTTPNAGRINASNAFGEYMHLDDSACNLASVNLLKYLNDDFSFAIEEFKHTVSIMFTAQEILVGYGEYPTDKIAKNARAYRQIGVGYANLGALLMAQGLAYDSDDGRAQAAAITALMTGHAYSVSAKLARQIGPFAGYDKDKEAILRVLRMHREEVSRISAGLVSEELLSAAASSWDEAVELAELYGIRNSQASLLAPTGTTALIMDCETTGIEPDVGLIKTKRLAGGETISLVSHIVTRGLQALGYSEQQINDIVQYIDDNKTIIEAPHLKKEHQYIFACSVGDNVIGYQGHLNMMAAVQPFISGAISKTVNTPEAVTVEDIEQIHIDAWKKGLKAVSVYRDNCRVPQIVSASKEVVEAEDANTAIDTSDKYILKGAVRRPLPRVRNSKTYKFQIADLEGYFTVGEYEDGNPGELFVNVSKQGSTLSGLTDSFAMSMSQGLQYGVPLKRFVRSLRGTSFAPSGMTDDPEIRTASSITDYIVRRLALDYLSFDDKLELGIVSINDIPSDQLTLIDDDSSSSHKEIEENPEVSTEFTPNAKVKLEISDSTAPLCYNCGNQTQRAGTCYVCTSCGSTTGCS